jgi:uncharacterized phiE125 gp8 family phage protein
MRIDNYQKEIRIVTVTAPAAEPVSVDEFKVHQRIDGNDENDLIEAYLTAAREMFEAYTGRRIVTRTEALLLDAFPPCAGIVIPVAPVSEVVSVSTFDEDDVETVLAASNYYVDLNGPVARVMLKNNASWPSLPTNHRPSSAVRVKFKAGNAPDTSVSPAIAAVYPERALLAIKLLAGHMYENREATSPLTIAEIPLGIRTLMGGLVVWEAKL